MPTPYHGPSNVAGGPMLENRGPRAHEIESSKGRSPQINLILQAICADRFPAREGMMLWDTLYCALKQRRNLFTHTILKLYTIL
jgi:hypothetical protein